MDGQTVTTSQASASSALRESLSFWTQFFERCIRERLDPDRFGTFVRLVQAEHPLPPAAIADLFLRPQPNNDFSLDPRIPQYLQVLSDLGYIDAPATLKALYKYSSSHTLVESHQAAGVQDNTNGHESKDKKQDPPRWKSSYWVEEVIFFRLCKAVHEGKAVLDTQTALEVVKIVSKWMALFTATSSAFAADIMGQMQELRFEMESARAAFVPLLLRLTDNIALLKVITKPAAKDARREMSLNLANFVPTLQLVNAGTEKSITEKLESFHNTALASHEPVDKKKQAADAAMDEMIESAVGVDSFEVRELPVITTRVGMYIYLNAALVGRPLLDDVVFFNYLNNRYRGDNQSAAIDLILASFDVLANAVFRDRGREDAPLLRSFLINKVPLLLCQLFPPDFSAGPAELCITNALNQVDTSLFPTASLMFDETRNNNPYTESVREEFCAACVLHGLVNREHVETILGEMSMSYEPEKKLKDKLVQDYLSHTIKSQDLLGDLDKMDGNVGAVCHAVVEVIRKLCNDKDTMSLKLLCTELVQRPQSLDILLLFETLPTILGPVCQLLDNWHYEEDQAEYQPVYEEFGAILLLVFAFTHRYKLKASDIGLYSVKSSVRRILSQAHINRDKEHLSEQEDKHLNGWILGLFDNDGGGLGDDLMSSCPPQEFYLLVAPLFYNIVVGYAHGYITDESLKSGVEYLVDTFLLPSLVPALRFLSDYLWVDQKEQKAIIKVLQLILLPSAISNEASAMLGSVKKIVAKPLDHSLQTYLNRRDPKNEDVNPLLNALKDSIPMSRRTGWADMSEVTEWCKPEPHGLWTSLKNTTQALMQWSIQPPTMNMMPITYSHRQFNAGSKMMGPQQVVKLILEEIRFQTRFEADPRNQSEQQMTQQNQISGVVHDVAMSLVCAPNVTNEPPAPCVENPPPASQSLLQRPLTLRDVLRLDAERCREIQKTDPQLAEITVRLHRRVEAQMALPEAPPVMMPAPDMTGDMTGDMAGMDMGAAPQPDMSLDAMAAMQGDVGLDMSGMDGLTGPGTATDGDGDLFGGLDTNLDDLGWGDSMDLG